MAAVAKQPPRGPLPWFEKLPQDQQAELLAIREEFKAGKLPCSARTLSFSIAAEVGTIKPYTVSRWLLDAT